MVWYGMVGPDQFLAIIMVGPLGRVGQRLLLRVVLLAPNQIIVRLNLGPRIALGEVELVRPFPGTPTQTHDRSQTNHPPSFFPPASSLPRPALFHA